MQLTHAGSNYTLCLLNYSRVHYPNTLGVQKAQITECSDNKLNFNKNNKCMADFSVLKSVQQM